MVNGNKEGVVPTLSKEGAVLSTPRDIIANVIAFSIMNPGDTSSLYKKDHVSFREILTEYSDQPDKIAYVYQEQLKEALMELYPDGTYSIEVGTEVVSDGETIINKFIVLVTDTSGNVVLNYDDLKASKDGQLLLQTNKG